MDNYETSDYQLAGYLLAVGHNYTLRRSGQRCFFRFPISPRLRESIDGWVRNRDVPVRNFCSALAAVREDIFGAR